jgi:hypothetical protein
MVIVTAAALVLGYFTARAALDTYRLESQPIIVMGLGAGEIADRGKLVVARYLLEKDGDDVCLVRTLARTADRVPVAPITVTNAGRSPAIELELRLDLQILQPSGEYLTAKQTWLHVGTIAIGHSAGFEVINKIESHCAIAIGAQARDEPEGTSKRPVSVAGCLNYLFFPPSALERLFKEP